MSADAPAPEVTRVPSFAAAASAAATQAADARFARRMWRLLAVLLALPSLLYLIGSGGNGWYLILPGFCLAGLVGRGSDTRVLAVALAASLPLPIVPVLFQIPPFELERVVLHGALAVLAWRGSLTRREGEGGGWFRLLLVAWLIWSFACSQRGMTLNRPVTGSPWSSYIELMTLERLIASISLVETTRPLTALFLRFDTLLTAWAAFLVARRAPGARRAVVDVLAWTVPLAVLLSVGEMGLASSWRGESFLARLSAGLPRSHRPLADHNSLASAMVLILPVLVGASWHAWFGARDRRGLMRWLLPVAAACAGLLLFSSRSKSGYGGVAVALAIGGLFVSGSFRPAARRALRLLIMVPLALVVATNLTTESLRQEIGSSRRGEDYLDLVYHERLTAYFRKNRVTVWRTGLDLALSAPWIGVGLGNFPRELAQHHDPDRPGFNPLHENAHDQYLQWWGEEGLVGLALAVALFLLAIVAGYRSLRGPPAEGGSALAWTVALCGLAVNLIAGHALLVPTVAILWAGWLGLVGATARSAGAWLPPWSLGLNMLLLFGGVVPGWFLERAAPFSVETGVQPWVLYPGETPDRARVLTADARWQQVWGQGARMILALDDPRPAGLESPPEWARPQLVSVAVNGEWVIEDRSLEATRKPGADFVYLKLDRPAGVLPNSAPVEIRVKSSVEFYGTQIFGKGREQVAVRMLPVVFVDPR